MLLRKEQASAILRLLRPVSNNTHRVTKAACLQRKASIEAAAIGSVVVAGEETPSSSESKGLQLTPEQSHDCTCQATKCHRARHGHKRSPSNPGELVAGDHASRGTPALCLLQSYKPTRKDWNDLPEVFSMFQTVATIRIVAVA